MPGPPCATARGHRAGAPAHGLPLGTCGLTFCGSGRVGSRSAVQDVWAHGPRFRTWGLTFCGSRRVAHVLPLRTCGHTVRGPGPAGPRPAAHSSSSCSTSRKRGATHNFDGRGLSKRRESPTSLYLAGTAGSLTLPWQSRRGARRCARADTPTLPYRERLLDRATARPRPGHGGQGAKRLRSATTG